MLSVAHYHILDHVLGYNSRFNVVKTLEREAEEEQSDICYKFLRQYQLLDEKELEKWLYQKNDLLVHIQLFHIIVIICCQQEYELTNDPVYNNLITLTIDIKNIFPPENYLLNIKSVFKLHKQKLMRVIHKQASTEARIWNSIVNRIVLLYKLSAEESPRPILKEFNNLLYNKCSQCETKSILLCPEYTNQGICADCMKLHLDDHDHRKTLELKINNTISKVKTVNAEWFIQFAKIHKRQISPKLFLILKKHLKKVHTFLDVDMEDQGKNVSVYKSFFKEMNKINDNSYQNWASNKITLVFEMLHVTIVASLKTEPQHAAASSLLELCNVIHRIFLKTEYWNTVKTVFELYNIHLYSFLTDFHNENWKMLVDHLTEFYIIKALKKKKTQNINQHSMTHLENSKCFLCGSNGLVISSVDMKDLGICSNCIASQFNMDTTNDTTNVVNEDFNGTVKNQILRFMQHLETIASVTKIQKCDTESAEDDHKLYLIQKEKQDRFLRRTELHLKCHKVEFYDTEVIANYIQTSIVTIFVNDNFQKDKQESLMTIYHKILELGTESDRCTFAFYLNELFNLTIDLKVVDFVQGHDKLTHTLNHHANCDKTVCKIASSVVDLHVIVMIQNTYEILESAFQKKMSNINSTLSISNGAVKCVFGKCNICIKDNKFIVNRGCCSFQSCLSCINQWISSKLSETLDEDDMRYESNFCIGCPGCRSYFTQSEILQAVGVDILGQAIRAFVPCCLRCLKPIWKMDENGLKIADMAHKEICPKCERYDLLSLITCNRCQQQRCYICEVMLPPETAVCFLNQIQNVQIKITNDLPMSRRHVTFQDEEIGGLDQDIQRTESTRSASLNYNITNEHVSRSSDHQLLETNPSNTTESNQNVQTHSVEPNNKNNEGSSTSVTKSNQNIDGIEILVNQSLRNERNIDNYITSVIVDRNEPSTSRSITNMEVIQVPTAIIYNENNWLSCDRCNRMCQCDSKSMEYVCPVCFIVYCMHCYEESYNYESKGIKKWWQLKWYFLGKSHKSSAYGIQGCKRNLFPDNDILRKTIRGFIFILKLLLFFAFLFPLVVLPVSIFMLIQTLFQYCHTRIMNYRHSSNYQHS